VYFLSQGSGIVERMFDSEIEEVTPGGLDTMAPGPVLAALLSGLDVAELSGHDRVVVLKAHQRMASHYTAEVYRDMVAVTTAVENVVELYDSPAGTPDVAAAEIRAALCLTRRAAEGELSFALDLKERLPKVWNALAAGHIDLRRTRVIVSGTSHLPEPVAREVSDRILDQAGGLTTGQLAAHIRKQCIQTNPDDAQDRYDKATDQRRVVTYPTPDGTTTLYGSDLPPDRAAAAMARINRIARSLRNNAETRTMDQLRADVLLDLLEGTATAHGTARGMVDIHVDLDTLAELADSPAELAGYGPVIADIARQISHRQQSSEWRFTITDPDNSQILHTGTTRRRPTTAQQRQVHARYQSCVFPGCRMPATSCDLDHRTPWAEGGTTTIDQLAPCCRHDHTIRHTGWAYTRLKNGDHRWTSPLGHTYATRSPPHL
jgi:hypothetical protein